MDENEVVEGEYLPLEEDDSDEDTDSQADGYAEVQEASVDELPPTDAEVEVAASELQPGEQVSSEEDDPADKGHLTELVCASCLELNLISKSCVRCARCEAAFCLHYASTVDAQYCVNCMSSISVTKETITKTYEHRNPETGEKSFYRRKARAIKIDGLDWLFAQRKIAELSDVELDLSIEYHRNILNLMIAEQERRRNEKMHRYANVIFKVPKTPSTTKVSDSTTTTVKKSRTVSKDKAMEQLAAVMKVMLAKGMTAEQIAQMFKKS